MYIITTNIYALYYIHINHSLIPLQTTRECRFADSNLRRRLCKIRGHNICLLGIYIFNYSKWNYAVHKNFNYKHKIIVIITTF